MRITNGRLVFEQYEKLTADGEKGCTEVYMTIPGLIRDLWRAADERMQIKMEF